MAGALASAALGYHLASRLAYVVGVGIALVRERREQVFTKRDGIAAGFERFRRLASRLMANDAVSFVLLSVVTRGTLRIGSPAGLALGGAILIAIGISVKVWAARTLEPRAYYWYDFFDPDAARLPDALGPYRYHDNPMSTAGYLHAYGFALLCGSLPGLAAAIFDQVAILTFARLVERPHFERLHPGA